MLITLEGIEGSGKSTQMSGICRYLRTTGRDCVSTKEPGGTPIGEKIRAILLDPANHHLDPTAELLLYAADRVQHVNELIRPALAQGKIVVCDRFADSTVVYQGAARNLDPGLIRQLNALVLGGMVPDVTFLLDLSPEIGLSRAWREIHSGNRDSAETRFESEALKFHQQVRDGYLALAEAEPGRFCIIDAGAGADAVHSAIIMELERFFDGHVP